MSEVWTPQRRELALREAESWLGVKHANHSMDRRRGVDCVHYVMAVYVAAGVVEARDLGKYDTLRGLYRESYELAEVLSRCVHSVLLLYQDGVRQEFGDIAVFRTGDCTAHCGFVSGPNIYHSLAGRCVVKSPWTQWGRRAKFLVRATGDGWKDDPVAVVNEIGGSR